jgi:hypothetical protein
MVKRDNDLQSTTHKHYKLSIRNPTKKEEKNRGELSTCSTSGTRRVKYLVTFKKNWINLFVFRLILALILAAVVT